MSFVPEPTDALSDALANTVQDAVTSGAQDAVANVMTHPLAHATTGAVRDVVKDVVTAAVSGTVSEGIQETIKGHALNAAGGVLSKLTDDATDKLTSKMHGMGGAFAKSALQSLSASVVSQAAKGLLDKPLAAVGSAVDPSIGGHTARLWFPDSPTTAVDVRQFTIANRFMAPFAATVLVRSSDDDLDFEALVGHRANFELLSHGLLDKPATWAGICASVEMMEAEPDGLSTYRIRLVHPLWLLTQKRGYHVHQYLSEPTIAANVLKSWGLEAQKAFNEADHPARKYKVQYDETDLDFVTRMLEEAGVTLSFDASLDPNAKPAELKPAKIVLSDRPQANPPRAPLGWARDPSSFGATHEYATRVRFGREVKPGRFTVADYDHRNPAYGLSETSALEGVEEPLEQYRYDPGAFVYETKPDAKGDSPVADDRGVARVDMKRAHALAEMRLSAARHGAFQVRFDTNAIDIVPGTVVAIANHPHRALGLGHPLLVIQVTVRGERSGRAIASCVAVHASDAYRPPLKTPKPKTLGVECATVVGPAGEEIHTDEFGRVRVQFNWDRHGKADEKSSCWIRVSQPWAGAAFGGSNLPRVGQEVIVDFYGGDPDKPVIIGRAYNNLSQTPYKLPDHKTKSVWRSSSTGGGGGYNEIRMDDKAGEEHLRIRAQKDLFKEVLCHEVERTRADRIIGVGGKLVIAATDIEIHASRSVKINGLEMTDVKGGQIRLNCDDEK
jgi:type VI secretion system secreted protein VgrG